MALDRDELDRIDELKRHEKEKAEEAVYHSIARMACTDVKDAKIEFVSEETKASISNSECTVRDIDIDFVSSSTPNRNHTSADLGETTESKVTNATPKTRPPVRVRLAGLVKFKHSHRYFKTPKRESTHIQEQIYLAKNSPHLKQNKYFNASDSDTSSSNIEETDPAWLKRKGDGYYRGGDYFAATNAYSAVISKDDVNGSSTYLPSLSNRAACYMHIGEFGHCIHDCETVLHAIEKDTDKKLGHKDILGNERMNRIHKKVLARLASAYCQLTDEHSKLNRLERMKSAQKFLAKALSLDNNDPYLDHDLQSLEKLIVAFQKKQYGDAAFSNGKSKEAIDLYTDAIKEHGSVLSAFANRAAANYESGNYQSCIMDCTHVLDTLRNVKGYENAVDMAKSSFATSMGGTPSPGTQKRADLVKSCLCRRAVAYQKLHQTTSAVEDLKTAAKFFGESSPELEDDIDTLIEIKQ